MELHGPIRESNPGSVNPKKVNFRYTIDLPLLCSIGILLKRGKYSRDPIDFLITSLVV